MDRKIVELLLSGQKIRAIAKMLPVGRERVRSILELAQDYGYVQEIGVAGTVALPAYPKALFEEPLDGRNHRQSDIHQCLDEWRSWIEEKISVGWHAITIFEELPISVSRSSFYRYLEKHRLLEKKEKVSTYEIRHKPGEALILDWGKLQDVSMGDSQKKKTLWMFVGVLGFSRYRMVRLVFDNKVETTIQAIESMFLELGGVPERITSDNPKCFATEASVYEPILNQRMERFANYYGVILECLPPSQPQMKGKIESQMPYCRRLYEGHSDIWVGLEESQEYFDQKLIIANEKPHGTTRQKPIDVFLEQEVSCLKNLPGLRYEIEVYHRGDVRKDESVRFDYKYYAVGTQYVGKTVDIFATQSQVSIFYEGQFLEIYSRVHDPNQRKASKPHLIPLHQKNLEDEQHYLQESLKIGEYAQRLVATLLNQKRGFINLRKIWGILSLNKTYSSELINEACKIALEVDSISYLGVKNILEAKGINATGTTVSQDSRTKSSHQSPRFVRPMSVYQEQLELFYPKIIN